MTRENTNPRCRHSLPRTHEKRFDDLRASHNLGGNHEAENSTCYHSVVIADTVVPEIYDVSEHF